MVAAHRWAVSAGQGLAPPALDRRGRWGARMKNQGGSSRAGVGEQCQFKIGLGSKASNILSQDVVHDVHEAGAALEVAAGARAAALLAADNVAVAACRGGVDTSAGGRQSSAHARMTALARAPAPQRASRRLGTHHSGSAVLARTAALPHPPARPARSRTGAVDLVAVLPQPHLRETKRGQRSAAMSGAAQAQSWAEAHAGACWLRGRNKE